MHRRRLLGLLTAALLAVPTAALAAGPGAVGLQVGDVLTVSGSEEGHATGLAVLGQEVTGTEGGGESALASTSDLGVPADVVDVAVLHTQVEGESSSATAATITVGGDEGATVTVLSSERDGDSAGTAGLTVRGGGEEVRALTSEVAADGNEVVVVGGMGTEVGADQTQTCDVPAPAMIDGQATCEAAGDGGQDAAILADASVQQAADWFSVDVLRANRVGDPVVVPPTIEPEPVPDPTPGPDGGPVTDADPTPLPPRSKGKHLGPSGDGTPLGAPVHQLANAGIAAGALAAAGFGMVAAGGVLLRRT